MPPPVERHSERRLTAYGARMLREHVADLEKRTSTVEGESVDGTLALVRLRDLLADAEVVKPAGAEHVALGARVRFRTEAGKERIVVLVTPDEVGLVPLAISVASPLALALLGSQVGETVELELPRGTEELTVVAIDWPI